ncbi:MAG: hypothetical protein ACKOFW_24795 [Planctomycetaceae bacterium]
MVLLALMLCMAEIGLRVYDSATAQLTRGRLYDRGMTGKSWTMHHQLKPCRSYLIRDPDSGQMTRVSVNSLGLRGPEVAIPKPTGTFRVIWLGDDVVFSPHVAERQTACQLLRGHLAEAIGGQVEVINAGTPNYCPLLSYLQARHGLLALQPDLVILNYDMTDVSDDHEVRWQLSSDADGLPVACTHPDLDLARPTGLGSSVFDALLLPRWGRESLNRMLSEHTSRGAGGSIDFPRSKYAWLAETPPPDWEKPIQQSFSPLALLDRMLSAEKIRLIVTSVPAPWQVSAKATTEGQAREIAGVPRNGIFLSTRPFEQLREYCGENRIEFCDVSESFRGHPDGATLYFRALAELSPAGQELLAEELAAYCAERPSGNRSLPLRLTGDYDLPVTPATPPR